MRYVSGTHALNLNDPSGTPGDWHQCCINWDRVPTWESDDSPFGDWGIRRSSLPDRDGVFNVANHVRACLDLIAAGYWSAAQGMRDCFLDDPSTTPVVFSQVARLKGRQGWDDVDRFMGREYMGQWVRFKEAEGWT